MNADSRCQSDISFRLMVLECGFRDHRWNEAALETVVCGRGLFRLAGRAPRTIQYECLGASREAA